MEDASNKCFDEAVKKNEKGIMQKVEERPLEIGGNPKSLKKKNLNCNVKDSLYPGYSPSISPMPPMPPTQHPYCPFPTPSIWN